MAEPTFTPDRRRTARRTIVRALESSAAQRSLPLLASAYLTARHRQRCRVTRLPDGLWAHRYRSATLIMPEVGAMSPDELATITLQQCLTEYVPRPGDVVVAVGAGVGGETLSLSQLVGPEGRVISVEAHPRTFACLQALVDVNDLRNVTPVAVAVAASDGRLELGDDERHVGNSAVLETSRTVTVPAQRLDGMLPELGVRRVDLLMMNIEGAETDALRGASKLIGSVRNAVICCHDFVAGGDEASPMATKADVRALLEDAGFAVTEHEHRLPWVRDTLYASRPLLAAA